MKPRLKLSTKIFLLCFLNLLLLGLVFLAFLRIQLRVGLESFLENPIQERALSVSRQLALELQDTDSSRWNAILANYEWKYLLEFHLLDSAGATVGGSRQLLPPSIASAAHELVEHSRPPSERLVSEQVLHEKDELEEHTIGHRRAHRPDTGDPDEPGDHGPKSPMFRQTTDDPDRYWVGIRILLPGQEVSDGVLVAGTTSWRSSLLLFDFKPWVLAGIGVLAISALCWLPLVHGLTSSVTRITAATAGITEGHFDVELPVRRRDEIGQLSQSINRMTSRLGNFVRGQKRFLGDVAHELCSPLARIQVALGILERSAVPGQEQSIADLREDVQHMSSLVNEVLLFSKAGLQPASIELQPVPVAATVARVIEREGSGANLVNSVEDEKLAVMAEPELLSRALGNLVRNAVRYAGGAGPIEISVHGEEGRVSIRVADHGPGLPDKDLETVFEPFYRIDSARDRESGGVGLGLAIVKTCIESCGGSVHCRNRQPSGLEVEVTLQQA